MEQTVDTQEKFIKQIATEQTLKITQVQSVINLFSEGNTVPFIARYRKEMTGALDEVQIRDIIERWQYIQNLEQRKGEVIRLIEEQGKLTPELNIQIEKADETSRSRRYYTVPISRNAGRRRPLLKKKD